MNLSIIIPSKTSSNLAPCVRAIRDHESVQWPIIVVDDGLDAIPPLGAGTVVPGEKPFVYARNINRGIRVAPKDDALLLNDDALLRTCDGFLAMWQLANEHPEFGLIAATCNEVGNTNQWPRNVGLREDPRMVCFVAVLIPRRTIDLVGLLDEEFTGYGYDDDSYCLRVRRAGLKIGIFDGCYVDHGSLKSTYRGTSYPAAAFAQNAEIFRRKYGASNHEL